jgi:tRNA (guanine-N7-)-methyltransferase
MVQEIINSTHLPWPTDWNTLFGRPAPLVVEIGFGNGEFLLHTARQHPEWNLIGVEISLPSLRKAAKKAANAGLTNVRIVQGDAQLLLWALCQPQTISGLFINFPDPWPKAGHVSRRLISDDFLTLAATRLRPAAFLDIATDHPDYQEWVIEHLARTPYFENRLPDVDMYTLSDVGRVVTKYEEKARREGRTPFYFKWQRNAQLAPDLFAVPEVVEMPHVIFDAPVDLNEIAARFEPMEFERDDLLVKMLDVLVSSREPTLIVETYVKERPLSQRVGLFIRRRNTGDYVVGLHELGFPRPTLGIQFAIHQLVKWLSALYPDLQITRSTLSEKVSQGK